MYEIDKEIAEMNYKVSELKTSAMQVLRSRINAYTMK